MYFNEPAWTFSGLMPETEPNIPKSTIFSSKSNSFYVFEEVLYFAPKSLVDYITVGL